MGREVPQEAEIEMRVLMRGIKVDQKEKCIEIDLNPKFYSKEAVEDALRDFDGLFSATRLPMITNKIIGTYLI